MLLGIKISFRQEEKEVYTEGQPFIFPTLNEDGAIFPNIFDEFHEDLLSHLYKFINYLQQIWQQAQQGVTGFQLYRNLSCRQIFWSLNKYHRMEVKDYKHLQDQLLTHLLLSLPNYFQYTFQSQDQIKFFYLLHFLIKKCFELITKFYYIHLQICHYLEAQRDSKNTQWRSPLRNIHIFEHQCQEHHLNLESYRQYGFNALGLAIFLLFPPLKLHHRRDVVKRLELFLLLQLFWLLKQAQLHHDLQAYSQEATHNKDSSLKQIHLHNQ